MGDKCRNITLPGRMIRGLEMDSFGSGKIGCRVGSLTTCWPVLRADICRGVAGLICVIWGGGITTSLKPEEISPGLTTVKLSLIRGEVKLVKLEAIPGS
jgi:hypothetical protein